MGGNTAGRLPIVAALVLGGAIAVASAQKHDDLAALNLPPSEKPYRELPALETNSANEVRTVVRTGEEAGITQIASLVRRSSFEEQWAYIPDIETWIEVGFHELALPDNSEVEVDADYLEHIVETYTVVHIYHFHPETYYAAAGWEYGILPLDYPAAEIPRHELLPVAFALPSLADVATSIQLSELAFANNPEAELRFFAVSPHGVAAYGPTREGLKAIHFEAGYPLAATVPTILTDMTVRRSEYNISRTIGVLKHPTIGDVIEDLCRQFSGRLYTVAFRPF